ncbi:hypothetical protein ADK38_12665, partial [Streptomyces varsoviensis]
MRRAVRPLGVGPGGGGTGSGAVGGYRTGPYGARVGARGTVPRGLGRPGMGGGLGQEAAGRALVAVGGPGGG